ncbi:MAG: type II toxin-antitoxin system RelE/ParE family toxin [Chitinophagales bacterium]|nr:type II toxin-antitoxin system RelE/ParE family toxin [Chitinophagales bacterium]
MTRFKYTFSSVAYEELKKSFDFYEVRKQGLGDSFEKHVEDQLEFLSQHPFSFPIYSNNARRMVLKDFPFSILYIADEENRIIKIIAVWHSSCNPKILKSRI